MRVLDEVNYNLPELLPAAFLRLLAREGLAERQHLHLAAVVEGNDAAGAGLEALVLPWEGADDAARVQRLVDVAADILGVDQAFLEGVVVEGEDVVGDQAFRPLVLVLVGREELLEAHADVLLELLGEVLPHEADGGVHRVVAGAAVDPPPLDLHVEHPVDELLRAAGMEAEIADEVLLRPAL